MRKFGKGFILAFFLSHFFFISPFSQAEDTAGDDYPLITQLNRRDENFKRLIADVEANRRRVFNREKSHNDSNRESADDIARALTIYRYVTNEDDSINSLAARCSIPYSALASANRLSNSAMFEPGRTMLIPSAPGIFVPKEPKSDIEILSASRRFPPSQDDAAELLMNGVDFFFFPGKEYDTTERAFFLNTGFRFPLRTYRLTSSFGMRKNPMTGNMRFHQGIDLAAPAGTEVRAVADGIVTEVGNDPILGNFIIIRHNNRKSAMTQSLGTLLLSGIITTGQACTATCKRPGPSCDQM